MTASLCPRRRQLYQAQVDETRKYFADLAATLPGGLRPALADPELIDALEELLNVFVAYGVWHDLRKLNQSQALFVKIGRDEEPPALSDLLPPAGAPTVAALDGTRRDRKVTPAQAYARYFEWCIAPTDVGGGRSGVDAFFERYPLLEHAVQTTTVHHRENIKLACERMRADWNDVAAAFFNGRLISSLVKLKTTGNDFHKGGKQVLILTFLLSDSSTARVVYKPSAVEVDCRIVGDSTVFGLVQPRGPLDQVPFTQQESLTEIINRHTPDKRRYGLPARKLPTYRILPYNRGSVPDSYGYIEFLTHNPLIAERDPTRVADAIAGFAAAGSDWIVATENEERAFFHEFGMLAGMALAVSLSDLHVQNVIVHRGQPHLIDLEDALKRPMKTLGETGITEALDRADDPVGKEMHISHEGTSDFLIEARQASPRPSTSTLYRVQGPRKPGRRATLDDVHNRLALLEGLIEVVGILAGDAGNQDVKAWVGGLAQTLARFVARPTRDIAPQSRRLFQVYSERSIAMLGQDRGYQTFSIKGDDGQTHHFFRSQDQRDAWATKYAAAKANRDWVAHPFFALEHKDHAWRDYLNCDVPSFYHALGSRDLLNSAGVRVNVKAAIQWQKAVMGVPAPAPYQPDATGAYLPDSPVNIVRAQLDALKTSCATSAGTASYLGDALEKLPELNAGFSGLLGRMLKAAHVGQEVSR